MTSIASRVRQNSPSHFMSIQSLNGLILGYNPNPGTTTFSTAQWAWVGTNVGTNSPYLSTLTTAGALLKDLGKNVVSSNRYFRKVQFVARNTPAGPGVSAASTFGVGGQALGTFPNADYLTGYIELGYEGGGVPAPVVQFGTM
jgi:hypothetical protein